MLLESYLWGKISTRVKMFSFMPIHDSCLGSLSKLFQCQYLVCSNETHDESLFVRKCLSKRDTWCYPKFPTIKHYTQVTIGLNKEVYVVLQVLRNGECPYPLKDIYFPDTTPKISFKMHFKHDYVFNLLRLYSKEVKIFLRCSRHSKNPIWCNGVEVLNKILPK